METFITFNLTYLVPLINACSLDGKKSKEVKSIILSAKEEGKSCEGKSISFHVINEVKAWKMLESDWLGTWRGTCRVHLLPTNTNSIYTTHTLRSSHTDLHYVYAKCMKSRAPFVQHHLISTIRYAFADWYYCCLLAHIKLNTDKAMKKQ